MINRFLSDSSFSKTIKINSLLSLLWWLAFFPGFYSGDSFAVLEMAKTGDLTSQWTYTWAVFTKLLTFHGQYPELATLFYSQAFAFSVSALSFTLNKSKHAASSAIVLCTTPVIGGMGITLWHDIPMTTGFMLTVIGAARLIQYKKSGFVYLTLGIFFFLFSI